MSRSFATWSALIRLDIPGMMTDISRDQPSVFGTVLIGKSGDIPNRKWRAFAANFKASGSSPAWTSETAAPRADIEPTKRIRAPSKGDGLRGICSGRRRSGGRRGPHPIVRLRGSCTPFEETDHGTVLIAVVGGMALNATSLEGFVGGRRLRIAGENSP